MTIHPKALKTLRVKKGLSQQDLAERCSQPGSGQNVSPKAIYRYEKGETKPSRKKAQVLAEALGTTVEELNSESRDDASSKAWFREQGYVEIRPLLNPDVVRNYRLVMHHYGVSMTDLIDAAPWMLTLLAEKSLAERKQRLIVAETAFEEAMERLPDHLGHGNLARTDFENACGDEEASISERDIFGETILNSGAASFVEPPFESLITNPFADFLRRTATEIGSNEINADHCEIPFGGDLPKWPVFTAWFDELTGEDWLAEHAIDKQYVKIGAIPPELLGTEKRTERVDWLIQQIPADERDRLIQDAARQLQELGVKL